ncbi:MAG: hypothetical protein P8L49_04430, partial [Opitutaceae bacterium]|nr:hypothetical protein [Opitutaceae bacterium]
YAVLFDPLSAEEAIWRYVKTVFWVIIVEIIAIAIVSTIDKPAAADERDKAIEAKAYKWGYYILISGLMIALWQTAVTGIGDLVENHPEMGEGISQIIQAYSATATPFITIHIILGALALAEAVKSATQLFFYRKGI